MKRLLVYIFFLLSLNSYSQIPTIVSNTSDDDKLRDEIYQSLSDSYQFVIAYTEESYWCSKRIYYQVVARKDDKWNYFTYWSKEKRNGKFKKPKVSTNAIDSKLADTLVSQLSKLSFWSLDSDSLNVQTKKVDNSTTERFSISDGVNYKFVIFTDNAYRVIEAYEPEYYLEKIPEIKSRQRFIKGRDIFKKVIEEIGT